MSGCFLEFGEVKVGRVGQSAEGEELNGDVCSVSNFRIRIPRRFGVLVEPDLTGAKLRLRVDFFDLISYCAT